MTDSTAAIAPAGSDAPGPSADAVRRDPIDWAVAARTAGALVPPGPRLSARQAKAEAEGLRRAADASVEHVHRLTGLEAARDLRDSQVLIVDRATWATANTRSFKALLAPTFAHLAATRPQEYAVSTTPVATAATGAELGAILAFLGSKVLGQYDPFAALSGNGGRLMLVAPNVAAVRAEINVVPEDFRLWVCLHEQTHRVQFAAAGWLAAHLQEKLTELSSALFDKSDSLPERLRAAFAAALPGKSNDDGPTGRPAVSADPAVTAVGEDPAHGAGGASAEEEAAVDLQTGAGAAVGKGGAGGPGGAERPGGAEGPGGAERPGGLLGALQDDEDRARLSHLTAVMSLLEGHANVVMDAVDAEVVETVKTIRRRFNARGDRRSPLERFVRRLIGMDAKMRQYADGQRFVDAAVAELGMDGFNVVWDDPALLPTEAEIHAPDLWVARMRREA
ncbi:possible hydrolase [Micrococcus lylae]|uniref:Possible hydrolase n=1 Tax=Micrococcus lylae TaxID=1273 RepID=A0A1R4JET7_9MICC|nr:zinc-dependent metalloprotease [Micrococcus lylae]SJN30499.1 possible hydrolase [Micrococcus lylae]